jgi:PAS domain-containing protein
MRPKETAHKARSNLIMESISDGVFTIDSEWRITSFSRA